MQIERIQIFKLFGMFDHNIKLKTDDRITIIHGPNGVGKTTILKLIKDVFDARFFGVNPVPFNKLIITFKSKQKFELSKTAKNQLEFKVKKGTKILHQELIKSSFKEGEIRRDFPLDIIDDVIPNLRRTGPRTWHDMAMDEMLSLDEVLFRYHEELPFRIKGLHLIKKETKKYLSLLNTYFIQTQRLLVLTDDARYGPSRRKFRTRHTVQKYSEEMAEMLQDTLRQSGSVAASLDRTFPHRLLGSGPPKKATESNIREKYQNQSIYRSRLMKSGLIDEEEQVSLPESNISRNDLKVLWFYLSDIDEKLKVFDSILKKVELFEDIINSRFLYKSFAINKQEGFLFTLNTGENIPLNCLSSGEQHELVLAYELLFRVPEKSFIMIDEPELSLHVTWQHKFLNDIERISKLADLDFLIATHSPSIIHDRRSLMVSLPEGGAIDD